jgi:hypothetical protein
MRRSNVSYEQSAASQTLQEAGNNEYAAPALSREEWDEIARRLREPFDAKEVDFRVQGRASESTGKAQVVAYIDARVVQDRLDNVVGAGNWAFDWTPLVIDQGEVQVAKGTLTVYGVSKSDAGSASNFEQSLGAVSHCFKRAAVHWGIGRYLYNLPMAWVPVERGRISEATLGELRNRLPKPGQPPSAAAPSANGPSERTAVRPAPVPTAAPAPARISERPTPAVRPALMPASNGSTAAKPATPAAPGEPPATEQQVASIRKLCAALGKPEPTPDPAMTFAQAKQTIIQLSGEYQRARKAS